MLTQTLFRFSFLVLCAATLAPAAALPGPSAARSESVVPGAARSKAAPAAPAAAGPGSANRGAAEAADERLLRKLTLHLKGVSLAELCTELTHQTGVLLRAARGVDDEKVTVLVKEQPVRDVLRAVARLFGYRWSRSGPRGEYRYELVQDLRSQLVEEELSRRDLNAALLALDGAMRGFSPYLDLNPAHARDRLRTATGSERERLSKLAGLAWGGMQLYHRLSPDERAALRNGQELAFNSHSPDPARRLPDEWRRPLLEAWGDQAIAPIQEPETALGYNIVIAPADLLRTRGLQPTPLVDWPDASSNIGLKISRSELGQLSLEASVGFTAPYKKLQPGIGGTEVLAVGRSPSAADPNNAAANQNVARHPLFQPEVSVRPKPSCPVLAARTSTPGAVLDPAVTEVEGYRQGRVRSARGFQPAAAGPEPIHVRSADVWEAVHRETGLPIVADSFTRLYPLSTVTVEKASLFDALCRVADAMGARWKQDGEFLLCRSTSFFWDRLKEVPNRYLQRWQQNSHARGGLPLEDLLEMAGLTDQQLDSTIVGESIRHCWGLEEWNLLQRPIGYYSPRPYLRFLAALVPELRRRALAPDGLRIGELPPARQHEIVTLLQERLGSYGPGPLDLLARRFRIDYVPAGWHVWYRSFGLSERFQMAHPPVVAGRTAAEALAAARRVDPSISADEIERLDGVLTVTLLWENGNAVTVAGRPPVEVRRESESLQPDAPAPVAAPQK